MKIVIIILLGLSINLNGQEYPKYYNPKTKLIDSTRLNELYNKIENNQVVDVKLYKHYISYYLDKIEKKYSKSFNQKNFLNDKENLQKGIFLISKGQKSNPDIFDYYIWKILGFEKTEQWDKLSDEIRIILHKTSNKTAWKDLNNIERNYSKGTILEIIKDIQYALLYKLESKDYRHIRNISQNVLDFYPENEISWYYMGYTYAITENFDLAIREFQKAEKVIPNSILILEHIFGCYDATGQKEKSIEYLNKIKSKGNKEEIKWANSEIKKINEKNR